MSNFGVFGLWTRMLGIYLGPLTGARLQPYSYDKPSIFISHFFKGSLSPSNFHNDWWGCGGRGTWTQTSKTEQVFFLKSVDSFSYQRSLSFCIYATDGVLVLSLLVNTYPSECYKPAHTLPKTYPHLYLCHFLVGEVVSHRSAFQLLNCIWQYPLNNSWQG